MSNDFVIDIETLGTDANATIVSIGVALINLENPEYELIDSLYIVCGLQQRGRNFTGETLTWWMTQSDEARRVFLDKNVVDLDTALASLVTWLGNGDGGTIDSIWSRGKDFDIGILGNAFTSHEFVIPWSYRAPSCLRDFEKLYPEIKAPPFEGTKHHALHDARNEAKHLHLLMQEHRYREELVSRVQTEAQRIAEQKAAKLTDKISPVPINYRIDPDVNSRAEELMTEAEPTRGSAAGQYDAS